MALIKSRGKAGQASMPRRPLPDARGIASACSPSFGQVDDLRLGVFFETLLAELGTEARLLGAAVGNIRSAGPGAC